MYLIYELYKNDCSALAVSLKVEHNDFNYLETIIDKQRNEGALCGSTCATTNVVQLFSSMSTSRVYAKKLHFLHDFLQDVRMFREILVLDASVYEQ